MKHPTSTILDRLYFEEIFFKNVDGYIYGGYVRDKIGGTTEIESDIDVSLTNSGDFEKEMMHIIHIFSKFYEVKYRGGFTYGDDHHVPYKFTIGGVDVDFVKYPVFNDFVVNGLKYERHEISKMEPSPSVGCEGWWSSVSVIDIINDIKNKRLRPLRSIETMTHRLQKMIEKGYGLVDPRADNRAYLDDPLYELRYG